MALDLVDGSIELLSSEERLDEVPFGEGGIHGSRARIAHDPP